jgi:hypothetical protein
MITIEQLDALAQQVENDNDAEHARLLRLCRAMTRILAARQPDAFERRPSSITDAAGHWDNSYPPKAEDHYDHAVPRMISICAHDHEDVPTSSGFYYSWRRQTTDLGCYVSKSGAWYGCQETGTGAVGQYAAHPGDHNRDIMLDYSRITPSLEQLKEAEKILRARLGEFIAGAA